MKYVIHFCKNKDCNNGWVDEDLTGCTDYPPKWKYCRECCNRLGIDFDSQKFNRKPRKWLLKHQFQKKNESCE